MAVESKHLGANLRFKDTERSSVMSLHRINPGIQGPQVTLIREAIEQVRGELVGGITMTVTSELVEE